MKLAQQIKQQLDTKRGEAQTAWAEFAKMRDDATAAGVDLAEGGEAFDKLHEAHKVYGSIAEEVAGLQDRLAKALDMEGAGPSDDPERREREDENKRDAGIWTPGLKLVQSEGYKQLAESGAFKQQGAHISMDPMEVMTREEFKTLIYGGSATGAGAFLQPDRQGYYPLLTTPLLIRNLVTVGSTDGDTVEFVKETSWTNNAAETPEATATTSTGYSNAAKPESALAFVVVQATVKTIANWIPVTKRAFADAGQLQTIVDQRLSDGVDVRLDSQMINGDGSGENLRGILNTSSVGSVTKGGGEPQVEAIMRGITTVRLAYLEPTGIGLHPNDWQDIRLMKTTDGIYTMGPPNISGPEQLWGIPVHQSVVYPEGTGLVGKYNEAILWVREGVTVSATDSHSDFFTHNLVAVLAEGRFAFGVPRPGAFCKVLSI